MTRDSPLETSKDARSLTDTRTYEDTLETLASDLTLVTTSFAYVSK